MGEFVAASGRKVSVGRDGSVRFVVANGYLSREAAYDAEEFFQARRDDELGRWRNPLDPQYVVYPDKADRVTVADENQGTHVVYTRAEVVGRPRDVLTARGRAAEAYFKSHPVREPWHDANAGEFWTVTHTTEVETCRVDDVNGTLRFVGVEGRGLSVSMPVTHHSITAAVRLVAEATA